MIAAGIPPLIYDAFGYEMVNLYLLAVGICYFLLVVLTLKLFSADSTPTTIASSADVQTETRQLCADHEDNSTRIEFKQWLTSSLVVFTLVYQFVQALKAWFQPVLSILFVEKMKMSNSVFGLLNIGAQVFAIVFGKVYLDTRKYLPYPYDMVLFNMMYAAGALLFIVFIPSITTSVVFAIILFPIISGIREVMQAQECVTRIFLCPQNIFDQMSGVGTISWAVFQFIMGMMFKSLVSFSIKLPMILLIVIIPILSLLILIVTSHRKRKLLGNDMQDKMATFLDESYLHAERYYSDRILQSLQRRSAVPLITFDDIETIISHKRISSMLMNGIIPPELIAKKRISVV
eukprot:124629_1